MTRAAMVSCQIPVVPAARPLLPSSSELRPETAAAIIGAAARSRAGWRASFFLLPTVFSVIACGREAPGPGDGAGDRDPVIEGSVEIHNSLDVNDLAGVSEITGDLDCRAAGLRSLVLPDLRRVGGALRIAHATDLVSLALPNLETVGGIASVEFNDLLLEVDLSALQHASLLEFEGNALLEDVSLPEFQATLGSGQEGGAIAVALCSALVTVHLPSLREIGTHLSVTGNPELRVLALPELRTIGGAVDVNGNPHLPLCAVEAILDHVTREDPGATDDLTGNDETTPCDP